MTHIAHRHRPAPISFDGLRNASPAMWWTGLTLIALSVACLGLMQVDGRLFNGINVWIKPAKFFLSIGVHLLTLTAALLLLPEGLRNSKGFRITAAIVSVSMIYKGVYIAFRSARMEPSHYNESAWGEFFYAIMGVCAVSFVLFTAWIGWRILRQGPRTLLAEAAGWSFIACAPLAIWTAGTLSSMGSHWIGGDMTDATGLPLFGWSTTGGDLRVSHFFSLHIVQIVPFAALFGSRKLMWAAMAGVIAVAAATYFQALAGMPLIPLH